MKKISLLFLAVVLFAGGSYAQNKTLFESRMNSFETLMSTSVKGAEKGDFAPLKANAPQMYKSAKFWFNTEIPAGYNAEAITSNLEKLQIRCNDLWAAVAKKAADTELKQIISEVNSYYKKVAAETKKSTK